MKTSLRSIVTSYREHEITAYREDCLAGYPLLYWSIFRESDRFECDSGFTEGDDRVEDFVGYLRDRVDAELLEDDPWMEKVK